MKETSSKDVDIADIKVFLRKKYEEVEGKMRVIHLWSDPFLHRFRLNWWSEVSLLSSKFIKVTVEDGKMSVKEVD